MSLQETEKMQQEAHAIADELEELGHQILALCEEFPEDILHWPPPFPEGRSLFSLALQAITFVEEWILVPMTGAPFSEMLCSKRSSIETFNHLRAAYKQWIQEVHKLLDTFPSSLLDCYVTHHPLADLTKSDGKSNTPCICSCLFHALVEIGTIVGKMQTIRQLLIDGERILVELTEQMDLDE